MAEAKNYGAKRLVVGAHYGTIDFIIQRVTAVIMAVYTLVLLIGILVMPAFTYENWTALFKPGERVLFLHTGGLPSLHAYEGVVLGDTPLRG